MACLLKLPQGLSKGIVTFTTQEWRYIKSSSILLQYMERLRDTYVTGLHFNWHDYQFSPPSQFDFFMAGEEDLRPVNDTHIAYCQWTHATSHRQPIFQLKQSQNFGIF